MKKEFQISSPCEESWSQMQNVSGGKFCDLCTKKVFDLTNKTDEEIQNLLDSENNSICGKIQASRLHTPREESKTNYNLFQFPFRKVASGIFLATMFASSINAQKKTSDTLRKNEIMGFIVYARRDSDDEKKDYYRPQIKDLQVKYSGNNDLLSNYNEVSILTFSKKYKADYRNIIKIDEDYLGFKNIFVFENQSNLYSDINKNQYYTFINKNKFKEGKIVDFNLDNIKKISFEPQNKELIYFLNGEVISKEEFEQKRKDKKIESYFLSEIYAKEILGDNYDIENGIILSYTK